MRHFRRRPLNAKFHRNSFNVFLQFVHVKGGKNPIFFSIPCKECDYNIICCVLAAMQITTMFIIVCSVTLTAVRELSDKYSFMCC
jgi:hypothetical protein